MELKRFKEIIAEQQEYKSAGTSLKQVSAGLKHAVTKGLIHPHSTNVDIGGGKYDAGKEHVEGNIEGAKMHVYDPYNRSEEHNSTVEKSTAGKSDYVGCHNVLNVIKDEKDRSDVIKKVKSSMHPEKGVAHFTVYEGDRSGKGRATQKDQSWQNHRKTGDYVDEIKKHFPDHNVTRSGANIVVKSNTDLK